MMGYLPCSNAERACLWSHVTPTTYRVLQLRASNHSIGNVVLAMLCLSFLSGSHGLFSSSAGFKGKGESTIVISE